MTALIAPMVVKYSWNAVHTHSSTATALPNGPVYVLIRESASFSSSIFCAFTSSSFCFQRFFQLYAGLMFIHSDSACAAILPVSATSCHDHLVRYLNAVPAGSQQRKYALPCKGIHGALMKQISGISKKNHRPFRDDDSLFSLPAFKECLVRQVRFVSVRLG